LLSTQGVVATAVTVSQVLQSFSQHASPATTEVATAVVAAGHAGQHAADFASQHFPSEHFPSAQGVASSAQLAVATQQATKVASPNATIDRMMTHLLVQNK
jgi:hypothetical protein